jgi:mRNA-degrading endonuclease RelE of RelBE toxin-antitoxin system
MANAQRGMTRLSTKAAAACLEFCIGPLAHDPTRVGKPLGDDLTGYHAARRGDYRIVFEVLAERRIVKVVRIEHRADVYRSR